MNKEAHFQEVPLAIADFLKAKFEEERVQIVGTRKYEQPAMENDKGYKYVTSLEVKMDWKEPIKANIVHNNTDRSFCDAYKQQFVDAWHRFAFKDNTVSLLGYTLQECQDVTKRIEHVSNEMYDFISKKEQKCTIFEFIKNQGLKTPVQLEIDMIKLKKDPVSQGNDKRYLKTYLNGMDVTGMVAKAIDKKISKSRDAYGTLIISGCGMDMFFAVQYQLYRCAEQYGYHNMVDRNVYKNKYYEKKLQKKAKNTVKQNDFGR